MRNIYFTILTIILLLGDILSKYLAEKFITERIEILGNFFSFHLVYNTGIAFSIALPAFFLKILTLVLIFGIIYYYFFSGKETRDAIKDVAVSLILAGAIGNGIERIFQGYVVDFLSVKYFSVFNLADIWISLGALLLIYIAYKKKTFTS